MKEVHKSMLKEREIIWRDNYMFQSKVRFTFNQFKRDTDVENKRMDTKGGKRVVGGGGGMNWEIGIDIHTLICIK